jgi:tetratricopeptide (TPR) repeat protein
MQGQYEEALPTVQQCIETGGDDYRLLLLQGKIQESLYRYDRAIDSYSQALRLNDEVSEIKSALAALYLKSGQPNMSAALYGQLAEAEPEIDRWKMNCATAPQSAGKYGKALNLLRDLVLKDSLNRGVLKDMGDCYLHVNNPDCATACYSKALNYNPNNKTLYVQLMKIGNRRKNNDTVIFIGKKAVDIDSTNVEAWKYPGLAWFNKGLHEDARRAFNKTVTLGDTGAITSLHLGMLHYFTKEYRLSEKYLDIALLHDPGNLTAMYYLSIVYGLTGRIDEGLKLTEEIEESIKQDTVRTRSHIQKGYLYVQKDLYDEAIKVYTAVVRADATQMGIFYNIAYLYDRMDKKKEALDWYIRFLNKMDARWETEEPKHSLLLVCKNRVEELRVDLFLKRDRKNNTTAIINSAEALS